MQAVYSQSLPPSGSEYAVSLRLTPYCLLKECKVVRNLVLARSNYLEIFNVVLDGESAKLVHVKSHSVHGIITGLARLKTLETATDGLHRLLVSYKDAKMATLEWSNDVYDLVPVSLHSFERLPDSISTTFNNRNQNVLRADVQSRCATLLLTVEHAPVIAVVPFFQDAGEDEGTGDSLPYAPSYILELANVHANIRNVIDYTFLDGFNEPTLAILYSILPPTCTKLDPGEEDCVSLIVVTLDLLVGTNPSHAVISHLQNAFPYDSHSIYACPRELGNVLVASGSALLHADQSGKLTGTAISAWHEKTSAIKLPLVSTGDPTTTPTFLENSSIVFVSPYRAFLWTATGLTYTIDFDRDGRTLSSINISKDPIGQGPVPSAAELIGREFIYVASAVGPGTLLRWHRQALANNSTDMDVDSNPDEDEFDLYGKTPKMNGAKTEVYLSTQALTWCDTLDAYGPIKAMTVGIVASDVQPEIVACTGGMTDGGLTVFHRGISPRKRRKVEIPFSRENPSQIALADSENSAIIYADTTSYTLDSQGSVQSTSKIEEFPLAVAQFGNGSIRVTQGSITYATETDDGVSVEDRVDLHLDSPILYVDFAFPYVSIQRHDRTTTYLVEGNSISPDPTVDLKTEDIQMTSLFHDRRRKLPLRKLQTNGDATKAPTHVKKENNADEEDGLYGDSKRGSKSTAKQNLHRNVFQGLEDTSTSRHWLASCSQRGLLKISPPTTRQAAFTNASLCYLPAILVDGPEIAAEPLPPAEDSEVVEIALFDLGQRHKRPHLAVLLKDGTFALYEATLNFNAPSNSEDRTQNLAIQFVKVLQQETTSRSISKSSILQTSRKFQQTETLLGSGLFICGSHPLWLMAGDHGPAHLFEFHQKPILHFLAQDSSSSEIIYADSDGIFTATIENACIDQALPWTPINAGKTYTDVVYDSPSETFVTATLYETPFVLFDDERPVWTPADPALNRPYACSFRSCLELLIPGSWETVNGYEFRQDESVMSIKSMVLESKGSSTGYRDFIGVGTAINKGEDASVRGATYVFEVVRVNEDEEASYHNRRLELLVVEDLKHPVSNVIDINGFFAHSMGLKLYVKALDNDERLLAVGFLDVGAHITSMRVLKNFLLLGDVLRGVTLVAFQEEPYKLVTLGRDYRSNGSVSADFLIYENKMVFVVTDGLGVLRLIEFNPQNLASRAGERLLCRTEFQTACEANATLIYAKRANSGEVAKQSGLLIGGNDGSLHSVGPLRDAVANRLQLVERQLYRYSPSFSALNAREFRTVQNDYVSRALSKGMLDGLLLDRFTPQHALRQMEMAKASNSTADTIRFNIASLKAPW